MPSLVNCYGNDSFHSIVVDNLVEDLRFCSVASFLRCGIVFTISKATSLFSALAKIM